MFVFNTCARVISNVLFCEGSKTEIGKNERPGISVKASRDTSGFYHPRKRRVDSREYSSSPSSESRGACFITGVRITMEMVPQNGKTRSTFKGHTGPVTSIAFTDKVTGSRDNKIMITGSWDQV